jgi:drug/metabolite transporter (DMT)-like permease
MVVVFALLAALSNAVNEATQHVASTAAPRRSSGWRLVLYLFRNPLWLLGLVALVAAFVFQALALHDGQISVVQPLLATELVFMLILRRFWIHQSIRLITWGAAAVTCVGLTVFIIAGQPGGGNPAPTSHHWLSAGLACCAVAAVLAVLARWGSPGLRAGLYASAAAVMWALVATFIKATTDTLAQFGVAGMFTRWPVYALAVGGVAALFLEQAALHVGPLRVSQPFLVIIDPIVSIALSVWLFGESFTSDAAVLAVAAVAFTVMCAGVVVLTQTAPATMKADIPADKAGDGQQARQAPPAGVQGSDSELPPGRAARDRGRPGSGRLRPERDGEGRAWSLTFC